VNKNRAIAVKKKTPFCVKMDRQLQKSDAFKAAKGSAFGCVSRKKIPPVSDFRLRNFRFATGY